MAVEDSSLTTAVDSSLAEALERIWSFLPNVIAASGLLLLGLVIAWLTGRFFRFLSTRLRDRFGTFSWVDDQTRGTAAFRLAPQILGTVVFWLVLLIFIVAAVDVLGMPAISALLVRAAVFLPHVLATLIIVLVGLFIGDLVRHVLESKLKRNHAGRAAVIGRSGQILVIITAGIIGIEQLGVDGSVLTLVLGVVFGTTLGAASLAFGLGARQSVANMIANQQVKKDYKVGDRIRINRIEGTVSEFGQTTITLHTNEGRAVIPACQFQEQVTVRLPLDEDGETAS